MCAFRDDIFVDEECEEETGDEEADKNGIFTVHSEAIDYYIPALNGHGTWLSSGMQLARMR